MGNLLGSVSKTSATAGVLTTNTPLILGLGAIWLIAYVISQTKQGSICVNRDGVAVDYTK